ncbi:thioredoxin family protein [Agromyces lapidis]|uniref:Thioredoxin family protein n=1 Tax=Agromyces lapidis TaxID=279574 RepID=A0ABV5SPU4_9MICO|nr:thioredoxin domain-containing protein [Agromyces lapidis]
MSSVALTLENFEHAVCTEDLVVVDFWAGWCGPCRSFAPVFESASEAHPDLLFGKVDTGAEPALAAGFRITSIPTLMVFREGVIVHARPGALDRVGLDLVIARARALDMDEVRRSLASQGEAAS